MIERRFTPWIVLACIGTLAACTSGEGGTTGNTELNVIVPTNAGTPDEVDIQTVEYTITCAGNDDVFLDNGASFADEVRIDGNLEVVDGRTDPQGPIPPEFGTPRPGDGAEVWQGFMDLPPGPCNIELRARDNDGEVICTASEPFIITADTTAKVNLVLICDTSFQAPVGMLDVDATFSFNVGNFCPDLFVLNCLDSAPVEEQVLPPPNPPLAATTCEVRFRDGDGTCGQGCDPQDCVPTATGLSCTPGPDPGVSTTITCNAATLLDCEGDGVPDPSCTINGDTLGVLPEFLDGVVPCATAADCGAPGAVCDGTGFCDFSNSNPFLNLSFAVACVPPALGGLPGAIVECTAVTTDGDTDCDKTKVVQVSCPGLAPCEQLGEDNGFPPTQAGGDAYCGSINLNDCQSSLCDDSSGSAVCVDSDLPAGTACTSAPSPAFCDGAGTCVSEDCNAQADPDGSCDDGNQCTVNACNAPPATDCSTTPVAGGTACDAGLGPSSGACDGVDTCVDICTANPACPEDSNPCTAASCDPVDGTCGQAPTNEGGTCDFSGPGAGDGSCVAGTCIFTPDDCGTTSGTVQIGCTNGVTTAQSPFPNAMTVTVNEPVFASSSFTASITGVGAFPKFFLDAAQSTVPGGVRSAIVEGFNATVEANNGSGQILLQADPSGITPGLTQYCTFPTDQTCTADGDCLVPPCNPPVLVAAVPIAEDCGPGGVCEGLGQGFADGPAAQCNITAAPEFCVVSGLAVPLFAPGGPQALTAGASGDVVFNWAVDPSTITCPSASDNGGVSCQSAGGTVPDGAVLLPASIYGDPVNNPASVGLNGIRLNVAGALFVALQCSAGQDGGSCSVTTSTGCLVDGDCPGGETCVGVGVDDDIIMPTDLSTVPTRCPIN